MESKKFIKISAIIFLVTGLILLLVPKHYFPDFYRPTYMGIVSLVSLVCIYLPQWLFKSSTPEKKEAIRQFQGIIAFSLLLNGAGELGLYQLYLVGFEYDKLIHMVISLSLAFIIGEMLAVWKNFSFRQSAWRSALALLAGGISWELWEMLSDRFFHTLEWGAYGRYVITDTIGDLLWNCVGIIFGLVLLKVIIEKRSSREE